MAVYPRSPVPFGFYPNGDINHFDIRRAIRFQLDHCIVPKSSPGVPLVKLFLSNEALGPHRELIEQAVYARILLLSGKPLDERSGLALVCLGLVDPVRVFVKNEPHALKKYQTKRFRLISSVALVDQVVERVLFSSQNKNEIAQHLAIPSQPGMGLDDQGISDIYNIVKAHSGPHFSGIAEADVTGFDWSVQLWELMMDVKVRICLYGVKATSPLGCAMRNRVWCLAHPVLTTCRGNMYEPKIPGIQLSGSFNTSSTNSRIRYLIARSVGASWAITMGDDCVEEQIEDAEQKYALLGHPLKMYRPCEGSFEFCSHVYSEQGGSFTAVPNYPKTLFRFIEQTEYTEELIIQFLYTMRSVPNLQTLVAHMLRIRPELIGTSLEYGAKEKETEKHKVPA